MKQFVCIRIYFDLEFPDPQCRVLCTAHRMVPFLGSMFMGQKLIRDIRDQKYLSSTFFKKQVKGR